MRTALVLTALLLASENALAAAPAGAPSVAEQLIPLFLIFVIFYFLILRPQSKKMKDHRNMTAALAKGDVVVTAGGVVAEVVALQDDDKALVKLADGVEVLIIKQTVTHKLDDEAKKLLKKTATKKAATKKTPAKKLTAKKATAKKPAAKK